MWALAEVRGTCSGGSKRQISMGSDFEHVEPSRPMKTHVQVKECSTGHEISGTFNVVNVVRHFLEMQKVKIMSDGSGNSLQ